jgi:NADPH:quinone reductase-like Zn-dependent oxidoreductase
MRDLGKVKKGQKVLVIGASGGIGTFAVQIAKIYGAEVTGVCGSSNIEMLKEIGADYVIDYTKEDYTTNSIKYDVIFDAVAAITLSDCRELLTDQGLYISNNPVNSPKSIWHAMFSKQFKTGTADEGSENLEQLREWIEAGELKPVIDTVYPLEKTAEAHRHYETGHSKGRVVISIDPIEEE